MNKETEIIDVVTAQNQAAMHSIMVMEQWGYGETYNEERWIERGRHAVRQTLEGMFELGRALIVLKEHTEHGYFEKIVNEQFGIQRNEAARLMRATQRFATPQMQKAAPKLMDLGKSKLLELLVEEDATLIGLAEGEEMNGMTLDDVDRMTVRELRIALRESRDETEAARKVSADKDQKINQLSEKLAKKSGAPALPKPEDVGAELTMQLSGIEVAARSQISALGGVFNALLAHSEAHGFDHTPQMVGALNQIIRDCEALRERFVLPAEAPTDGVPEWVKEEG